MQQNQEEVIQKFKGKPITCQLCGYKFSMVNPEEREAWKENNFICPKCGEDYVVLPETERILRKLQDSYFACNRDNKYLTEMYKILKSYAESLLKKYFSNRLYDIPDALNYYSHTASQLLIMRYLQKDDFIITISFGNFLIKKLPEAIFSKFEHSIFNEVKVGKDKDGKHITGVVDTLNYEFQDGSIIEYADNKKSVIQKIEENEDRSNLCITLFQLVSEVGNKCYSRSENYTRLLAVHHFLSKGENYVDRLFNVYGKEGKEKYLETISLLQSYLTQQSDITKSADRCYKN